MPFFIKVVRVERSRIRIISKYNETNEFKLYKIGLVLGNTYVYNMKLSLTVGSADSIHWKNRFYFHVDRAQMHIDGNPSL